jgi:hypothetical protein
MQQLAAARPSARWAQQQCRRAAVQQQQHQPRPIFLGPRSLLRRRHASSSATAVVAAATATPDPFFAAPSELQSFDQMQRAMRQFDRDMDSLFWGPGRSPFAEAEREIESALRQADEAAAQARREAAARTTTASDDGRVRVERSETRAPGTYRYYERIEINGGGGGAWAAPTVAAASAPPPLLLLAALIAAGAYAALTAAFARNFDLTLYAARDKLRLALTWPLLLLTSRSFRAQFASAVLKGEKVRVTRPSGVLDVGGVVEEDKGQGPEGGGRRQGA